MTENIPLWDLSSIYKDLESPEYKKDLEDLKKLIQNVKQHLENFEKGTCDFDGFLKTYLEYDNKLAYYGKTIFAYAYIIYSTDTTNTKYMNNLNVADDLSVEIHSISVKFSGILYKNKEKIPEFLKKHEEFKEYEYILEETITSKMHQMSEKEEELAAKMSHTGAGAWSLLQEQIISNLHDEKGKTFNELRNDANDASAVLRKQSYEKEIELLKQNQIAFAASLNNLKGETVALNKKRSWNTALDKALFSSRLKKQTLEALISSIEDSLPQWRKYFQAKALILRKTGNTASKTSGTKENPGLAFYDLFAPLSDSKAGNSSNNSLVSKKWTFSEAKDYVLKEYYSFSTEMGDFAKNAFENNWIDAKVRKGKVGGAYDEDFPKGHQSRVLSNFTGVFSDIITLAHELGHAYHFSCMKNKAPVFFDYPMTLAESASTFAETIVKQDLIKQSSGFDKIKILDLDLQDTAQVLVDILCRFYFESKVFEQKEKGIELNAEDFSSFMEEAQEKSYGSGLNEERHPLMWAVKSHYYIPDLDFYNFPYAFGQLFAAGLYTKSLKEGPEFAKTYAKILSETGSQSCENLCKLAGFDITTKAFWKEGISMYEKEIAEYCDFAAKLN